MSLFSGLCVFLLWGGIWRSAERMQGFPGSFAARTAGHVQRYWHAAPLVQSTAFPARLFFCSSQRLGSLLIWISNPPSPMTSPQSFKICVGANSAKPNQQYKFASSRIGSKMQVWGREEPVESRRGVKGIQTPRSPSLLPVSWRGLERGPLVNHWVIYRLILVPPPRNEWIPSQHAPGRVFL